MASSTLDQIRAGARILVDAPIFIYHFTGVSLEASWATPLTVVGGRVVFPAFNRITA